MKLRQHRQPNAVEVRRAGFPVVCVLAIRKRHAEGDCEKQGTDCNFHEVVAIGGSAVEPGTPCTSSPQSLRRFPRKSTWRLQRRHPGCACGTGPLLAPNGRYTLLLLGKLRMADWTASGSLATGETRQQPALPGDHRPPSTHAGELPGTRRLFDRCEIIALAISAWPLSRPSSFVRGREKSSGARTVSAIYGKQGWQTDKDGTSRGIGAGGGGWNRP